MKRVFFLFLGVIAVAALATFCTLHWSEAHAANTKDTAAHEWLHHALELTDIQRKALEPIEVEFAEKQHELAALLRAENGKLARFLKEDKAYTPRVAAQIEMVHHCMVDLQKASIEHLFAMRAVLTPSQGDKLLTLAQRALEQSP